MPHYPQAEFLPFRAASYALSHALPASCLWLRAAAPKDMRYSGLSGYRLFRLHPKL